MTISKKMQKNAKKMMEDYLRETEVICNMTLTAKEEEAIEALNARIRLIDETWGDSINDDLAILRVVLAGRISGRSRG